MLSPLLDYCINFDLLQYQYDRWLFKTITGEVNSSKAFSFSPNCIINYRSYLSYDGVRKQLKWTGQPENFKHFVHSRLSVEGSWDEGNKGKQQIFKSVEKSFTIIWYNTTPVLQVQGPNKACFLAQILNLVKSISDESETDGLNHKHSCEAPQEKILPV